MNYSIHLNFPTTNDLWVFVKDYEEYKKWKKENEPRDDSNHNVGSPNDNVNDVK